MTFRISNYDGLPRIVSYCCEDCSKTDLTSRGVSHFVLHEDSICFFPENVSFNISDEEKEKILLMNDCDIFEVSPNGKFIRIYDSNSEDNVILITNSCNSNCVMCPTPETIRKNGYIYTTETIFEILKHIPPDTPHLTITGGEPFLIKKDMFKIFEYLKYNLDEIDYLLLTNGRAFCIEEYSDLLAQTKPRMLKIGIPIHGHTAELHDSISQCKGSFNQTIIGLKNIISRNIFVELRIVVSKLNCNHIYDIAQLIVNELPGISTVKFIGLEMTGNARENCNDVWIDYTTAFNKSKKAIDLLIHDGIDVGLYNFPLCSVTPGYWSLCEKSISEHKIKYFDKCDDCSVKDACGGVFAGSQKFAFNQVKSIGK